MTDFTEINDNGVVFEAIDQLIGTAVPERRDDLNALWRLYSPQFRLWSDRAGFVMQTGCGAVCFTQRTLLQIWLLGFAAWRAVEAYADIIRTCAASRLVFDPPRWPHSPASPRSMRLLTGYAQLPQNLIRPITLHL